MKYDQYAYEAHKFVSEVAIELGDPHNIGRADRIMTAVFHALRDILSPEESLHLVSQLPMLIKAVYVNGWHLTKKSRTHSMDEFIEALMLKNPGAAAKDFGNDEKAKEKARAVFSVIRKHISVGEVKDIIAQLPAELTELWLSPTEKKNKLSVKSG